MQKMLFVNLKDFIDNKAINIMEINCPDTARRAKERLLACQDNYYHWLAESINPNEYTGTH